MKARLWICRFLALLLLTVISYGHAAEPAQPLSPLGQFHVQHGVTCTNCHNTAQPTAAAPASACLTCHAGADGHYDGTQRTYTFDGGVKVAANPHQSHLVDLPCTECHKVHVASVNYCNQCHLIRDMNVK